MDGLGEILAQRKDAGLYRTLKTITARTQGRITINGEEYIDFASNDYLGLAQHPQLIAASKAALDRFGTGSCASRLLSGTLSLHRELEAAVARFKHKPAALVFNSGYQANGAIISALYGRHDAVFCDRLVHASIIDGVALSGAKLIRFEHNTIEDLVRLLQTKRNDFKNALIATESIFSMDGDCADLKALAGVKSKFNCRLLVDEAHAGGVFGPTGAGLVEAQGVSEEVDLIMGTFSKAFGSFGAYLAADKTTIEYLINCARGFIFSTSLPPSVVAASLAAVKVVQDEPLRRKSLLENAQYFRQMLREKKFNVYGDSQIVPVVIGDNFKAIETAQALQDQGYWVMAVRPPTVPANTARLRFSLMAYHDKNLIDSLVDALCKILK